jgi:hypothetical protein
MSADSARRNRQLILVALVACFATAPALAQRGAITVPANLDRLVDRAADIVRGHVISARVEKHPELTNLDTVVVTLRVRETLKGYARETFTFRQYIWDIRDRYDAAGYAKGQDLLLLMTAPSAYGLSSPTGLDQGRFRISRDRAGREVAMNGAGNVRLFHGLEADVAKEGAVLSRAHSTLAAKHRRGPVEMGELAALIRELARSE